MDTLHLLPGERSTTAHHLPQAHHKSPPKLLAQLFAAAGICINGPEPFDIQVHDARTYDEILSRWSLGLGEAYMAGYWSCEQPDEMIARLLLLDMHEQVRGASRLRLLLEALRAKLINLQTPRRALAVVHQHYDIGNEVFEAMLDARMMYSCAYWQHAQTLEQAQEHKLEMICRKLELKAGERLLDIGCGWGGLAAYAAQRHGVIVKGITLSKEQQRHAQRVCEGLPVVIELKDYRELNERFDKIVSVGMFEHVGVKNYPRYFDAVSRMLDDEGLFLLHSIGSNVTTSTTDPWIDKYIFPHGKLPSALELSRALEGRLLIEDWHNFGPDYDRTLMAWHENFNRAWPKLSAKYDQRFYRMWRYYLLSCAGFFRSRQGQLWQLVLTKRQRKQVYRSVRI